MPRLIIIILVLLLLFTGGMSLVLGIFLFSARTALDQPNPIAFTIAESGKGLLIPPDAQARKNPITLTPELLNSTRKIFTSRCIVCHGDDGKGQTTIGQHTYPRAADLTQPRTQNKSDGSLDWLIENGIPHTGMPGWKDLLKEQEMWQLVALIRQLPKGLPPEPTPTPFPTPTAQASTSPTALRLPATVTVTIENAIFIPAQLTIAPGTRVVWLNLDDDDHSVLAEGESVWVDSPIFKKGQTFEFVFTQAGTFRHTCRVHDYMHAVIIVK